MERKKLTVRKKQKSGTREKKKLKQNKQFRQNTFIGTTTILFFQSWDQFIKNKITIHELFN